MRGLKIPNPPNNRPLKKKRKNRHRLQSELLQEIDRRFRELDIEIPFPQRDFHLRSVDSPAADALQSSTATGDSAGTRTQTPDH